MKPTSTGPEHFRSLEALAGGPHIQELLEKEFPGYDPGQIASVSRRRFMKLMGASMALAGLTLGGCRRQPKEKLAPFTAGNAARVPGIPEQYATVMEVGGVASGLLVTTYDGRPIKIEGNPLHPMSRTFGGKLGAADAWAQASVLSLYDPDRSRSPMVRDGQSQRPATWEQFASEWSAVAADLKKQNGAGLAILSEATGSPSVLDMRERLLKAYPQAKWYEYEPINRDNEIVGRPLLHLDKASVVVLLDADILGTHPNRVRYANDWAARRATADQGQMSRVYVAESQFSVTGTVADERLAVRPSRIDLIAMALASELRATGQLVELGLSPREKEFVASAARDLRAAGKAGLLAAGPEASPQVHALVHAANAAIGAIGSTVTLVHEREARTASVESIRALAVALEAGQIDTLLILGGNPVYDAPADVRFEQVLAKARVSIHLSHYQDETSAACRWHLPRAHYLESWGDGRAWDGTLGVCQPTILPLFGGKSVIEVLALVSGDSETEGERIVRRTWRQYIKDSDFDRAFRRVLHDGLLVGSQASAAATIPAALPAAAASQEAGGFELRFLPSGNTFDGRFANNGWLQEMPDSLTKLTWDNAALICPADAAGLGVKTGDMVNITVSGRSLAIPVFILPGQPAGVIGLPLGYGRRAGGHIATGVGFDTYRLRTSDTMWFATGAQVTKAPGRHDLAVTQDHHLLDAVGTWGRDKRVGTKGRTGMVVREATLEEYRADRHAAHKHSHSIVSLPIYTPPASARNEPAYEGAPAAFNRPHAWGMTIDMNKCTGCNACVVACQAENNVPIVGRDQVLVSREMHWLRIDRYFKSDPKTDPQMADVQVVHQPMMCVHCENAPCEQVCPVAATVHDTEGLNTMVYNRCIGTRYCSNNCPYKVRRFNYFDYHAKDARGAAMPYPGMPDEQQRAEIDPVRQMGFNPDVTVRMRGVMEKCTFCVQRIKAATTRRRADGTEVKDFDVVTACQQACPTEAIVFGNLNDQGALVSQQRRGPRAYAVLEELNTVARTKHLAKVRNPVDRSQKAER